MRKLRYGLVIGAALLAAMLVSPGLTGPAGTQSGKMPPLPKAAEDAYVRAWNIIETLDALPDKAAGSPQWDVAIKRLMEAQELAPEAPQILRALGLAQKYRGRAAAAAAWSEAALLATRRADPSSPDIAMMAKQIQALKEVPRDQLELGLTFAREELPYLHAKKPPAIGTDEELYPPQASLPMGPVVVDLTGGQGMRNPELYNKDGSPKLPDIPAERLEKALIGFRLSIGDVTAIPEAENFRTEGRTADVITRSLVRLNAYKICLNALTRAEAWPAVARLAAEAADWCEQNRTAWTDGQAPRFRQMSEEMAAAVRNDKTDKIERWIDLAKELARSDDEVYFQVKIDGLHKRTDKGEALLEGIARAVEPIARSLMRLQSIED